jgi:uncharacterized protein
MASSYFLYKLIPPRPSFPVDMSETEAAIMTEHFAYWQDLINRDSVLIYGPVADPNGAWGLAIVTADGESEVREIGAADPAVSSRLATFDVLALPDAIMK